MNAAGIRGGENECRGGLTVGKKENFAGWHQEGWLGLRTRYSVVSVEWLAEDRMKESRVYVRSRRLRFELAQSAVRV